MKGKPTKAEKLLLGCAAVYLCLVLGLFARAPRAGVQLAAQHDAAASALVPAPAAIDLNTATAEELAALPGIGETLAGRIVAYREAHGGFADIQELQNVRGIGEGKLAAIAEEITVGKGTT